MDENTKDQNKQEEVKKEEEKGEEAEETKEAETPANEPALEGGADFEVPAQFKDMIEHVKQMSVLELHEFVKTLEGVFGVSASAVAVAVPGAGGGDGAGEEEKSTFTVHLADFGAQKIAVIKVVKEAMGLGLKEAKDIVESAPAELVKDMKKEDAEALKEKLEGAGAKVELK